MENFHCRIFHPQPPNGGSCSGQRQSWYAAEVPFRGFRGNSKMEFDIIKGEKL